MVKKKTKIKKLFSMVIMFAVVAATVLSPFATEEAEAASSGYATTSLSYAHKGLSIPTLNYKASSDNLWNIYVTSTNSSTSYRSFCLTPHGSCHSGDTYYYQSYNAVTYSDKAIAKAMTYWGQKMSYSTLNHACIQAVHLGMRCRQEQRAMRV